MKIRVSPKNNKVLPIRPDNKLELFSFQPQSTLSPRSTHKNHVSIVEIDGNEPVNKKLIHQPAEREEYPEIRLLKTTVKGLAEARQKIKRIDQQKHRYTSSAPPLLQIEAANCRVDTRIEQKIKLYYTKMLEDFVKNHPEQQNKYQQRIVIAQTQGKQKNSPGRTKSPELLAKTINISGEKTPRLKAVQFLDSHRTISPKKKQSPSRPLRRKIQYDQIDEYMRTISIDLKPATAGFFRKTKDTLVFDHFTPSVRDNLINGYSLPKHVKKAPRAHSREIKTSRLPWRESLNNKQGNSLSVWEPSKTVPLTEFRLEGWSKNVLDQEEEAAY